MLWARVSQRDFCFCGGATFSMLSNPRALPWAVGLLGFQAAFYSPPM